jgi:hypothetical protein
LFCDPGLAPQALFCRLLSQAQAGVLHYSSKRLAVTPAKYASNAAIVPTISVVRPECHHDAVDHLLFIEPITKKTIPVMMTESVSECAVPVK